MKTYIIKFTNFENPESPDGMAIVIAPSLPVAVEKFVEKAKPLSSAPVSDLITEAYEMKEKVTIISAGHLTPF